MSRRRAHTPPFLALLLVMGLAAVALAQDSARVSVSVSGGDGAPTDATVTLTPQEGGPSVSCRTSQGRCEIANVPRGRYVVTAAPTTSGQPPLPQVVWVPPRVPSVDVRVRLR